LLDFDEPRFDGLFAEMCNCFEIDYDYMIDCIFLL
jgi:hypothetical protein